jgi:ABC-type multidrug transport system permease subunit
MNLMGGGLWGIGFSLVDLRVRKLLKRLLATPMRRRDFLLSMVGMRVIFFIPEMGVLLLAASLIFAVPIRGSLLDVVLIAFVGSLSFAGLGLLVASRARRIETVSGLMNLVMLPMWLASGIFFSSERFPDWSQPLVQALPLTQLNNALRAVILEGDTLVGQIRPLLILLAWGGVSFFFALRWFRWSN